ncbi:hypothetical protein [Sphingobacterium suaedae]|uniref:Uncharacterized protein n=1 Tax=Sphingobacterium suaedae TaxID=1686402 RepID=A0ABW5KMW2_9SPHI
MGFVNDGLKGVELTVMPSVDRHLDHTCQASLVRKFKHYLTRITIQHQFMLTVAVTEQLSSTPKIFA